MKLRRNKFKHKTYFGKVSIIILVALRVFLNKLKKSQCSIVPNIRTHFHLLFSFRYSMDSVPGVKNPGYGKKGHATEQQ